MVEFTIPLILDIIRTAGILVGIIYYLTIMRNQSRTREAQFLLLVQQIYQNKEFGGDWTEIMSDWEFKDYQEFSEKYGLSAGKDVYLKGASVFGMFNSFGNMIKRGLVSPETIFDSLNGPTIIRTWDKYAPIVRELRDEYGDPFRHWGFEYCAEELRKIQERKLQSTA